MSQTSAKAEGIGSYLVKHLREYGLLFALIAIMVFFQVVTDGTLLKPVNITNLFLQNSYIIIMALGMLMVIVAGHIDLSVGPVMGFVGALAAVMLSTSGSLTPSLDITFDMIWTSSVKPLGNNGRIGRSVRRLVRISRVVGRPSRFKYPPANRPAAASRSR